MKINRLMQVVFVSGLVSLAGLAAADEAQSPSVAASQAEIGCGDAADDGALALCGDDVDDDEDDDANTLCGGDSDDDDDDEDDDSDTSFCG